jgi:hypothetical protein
LIHAASAQRIKNKKAGDRRRPFRVMMFVQYQ